MIRDKKVEHREYADPLLFFIDYLLEVPREMSGELQEEIEPMVEEVNHMERMKYPDPPTLKPIYDKIRVKERKEIALAMLRKLRMKISLM
ncbi:hypothetical protein Len3610_12680 [Lentibacillus sp. CBA3610]|nr:hypothetical protein Len3610_12680 [Lentibacillus sp. CBA3610]